MVGFRPLLSPPPTFFFPPRTGQISSFFSSFSLSLCEIDDVFASSSPLSLSGDQWRSPPNGPDGKREGRGRRHWREREGKRFVCEHFLMWNTEGDPTTNGWHAKRKLGRNTYALRARFFLHARRRLACSVGDLVTKFLRRRSGGSLLCLCCCWLVGRGGETILRV